LLEICAGVGIGEGLYIVVINFLKVGDLERLRYESVASKGILFGEGDESTALGPMLLA